MQFNTVQSAAKAIHYANMQSLLNRPMIVDWAVPKNKFSQNNIDVKPEIKIESDENEAHDISETTIIDNSEDENGELDESNRYLIRIVFIDRSIYIFFRILLYFIIIFFLINLFLTYFFHFFFFLPPSVFLYLCIINIFIIL